MDFTSFFGRLHPLFVHFPVAILLLAAVLTLFFRGEKFEFLRPVLPAIWIFGAASAVLACATGWFLATENAGEPALFWHRWLGTGTAFLAAAAAFFSKKMSVAARGMAIFSGLILLFALPTLHLGTSMTHGAGYFLEEKNEFTAATPQEKGLSPADDLPENLVEPAKTSDIFLLKKLGLVVLPVAAGSPFLSVNAVNAANFSDSTAVVLEKIAPQIVWLKLSGAAVGDSTAAVLGKLKNLSRLHLDNTKITDGGIFHLKNLKNLRLLNLSGTQISAAGLAPLADLPNLQELFLFKTRVVGTSDWDFLKSKFPKTRIDTGGYFVPTLPGDTVILKAQK